MKSRRSLLGLFIGGAFVVAGLGMMGLGMWPRPVPTPSPLIVVPPSPTPEPLVPTRTSEVQAAPSRTPESVVLPSSTPVPVAPTTATASPELSPAATSSPAPATTAFLSLSATPLATPTAAPVVPTIPVSAGFPVPAHERFRLGVSLPGGAAQSYDDGRSVRLHTLGVGWVMDWSVRASTALPPGVDYAQTVRMMGGLIKPDAATLTAVAVARPGSMWLISNEADVRWQDNVDPATYARLYHDAYAAIKAGDASAVVAAGGIAQPTPLRLRYLDMVLEAYRTQFGEALPAQAWHIHNYMLHEERDSWGVDIPPGISDNSGVLYSIDDSGNLEAFRAQIWAFRRWMALRGYGGQPLIVSEFGVPMPADYGFPAARMADFLEETWRFFLTAADPALGDPNDGGRLVQRWCWFSLSDPTYATGNLLDGAIGSNVPFAWTPLGRVWISLVSD